MHPAAAAAGAATAAATTAANGSVVLMFANPSTHRVNVSIASLLGGGPLATASGRGFNGGDGGGDDGGRGWAFLATTPRVDWVFSAPGGPDDLAAVAPVLNAFDGGGVLLRVAEDGGLPPMRGFYVPADGEEALSLPPRSQGFSVLLEAAAAACMPPPPPPPLPN